MQYGNMRVCDRWKPHRKSLNRTMQYGNKLPSNSTAYTLPGFKSYYVVWKQRRLTQPNAKNPCLNRTMQYGNSVMRKVLVYREWFKSYYVVWKPQKIAPKIAEKVKFKSYYVVWKQQRPTRKYATLNSLNRTMQYGNIEKPLALHRIFFRFKSYYVVWKQISEKPKKAQDIV